jgi:hypothetical protein
MQTTTPLIHQTGKSWRCDLPIACCDCSPKCRLIASIVATVVSIIFITLGAALHKSELITWSVVIFIICLSSLAALISNYFWQPSRTTVRVPFSSETVEVVSSSTSSSELEQSRES